MSDKEHRMQMLQPEPADGWAFIYLYFCVLFLNYNLICLSYEIKGGIVIIIITVRQKRSS